MRGILAREKLFNYCQICMAIAAKIIGLILYATIRTEHIGF